MKKENPDARAGRVSDKRRRRVIKRETERLAGERDRHVKPQKPAGAAAKRRSKHKIAAASRKKNRASKRNN